MTAIATPSGSAERWGPLWGARAEDWAANENRQTDAYSETIRRLGIGPGQSVLDIGCGAGAFIAAAAGAGATPSGIDASAALAELARRRTPGADVRLGEMERLPFANDAFDVVTGFNSFFFADDMIAALAEARRVAKPGAAVVIQVWGHPERCDLEAMKAVVRPFFPAPPSDAPDPEPLWKAGVLEGAAAAAGLSPETAFDVTVGLVYPDAETLGRESMAVMGLAELVGPDREDEVRTAVVEALAPHRKPDGSYRLENDFHYLVARA